MEKTAYHVDTFCSCCSDVCEIDGGDVNVCMSKAYTPVERLCLYK
jgi:hypothetical protein